MEIEKELKALFGESKPSVHLYKETIEKMSPDNRKQFAHRLYGYAMSRWTEMNAEYRRFFVNLLKSERQQYLDYLHTHTPLGQMRTPLPDAELFTRIFHLLISPTKYYRPPYTRISFALLLGFNISLRIKTFSDRLRYARPDTDELVCLFGKARIEDAGRIL